MSGGSITIEHLTVAYERHVALRNVDGRFDPGSMTAVVGPNGAGKSTLVKAMVGPIKPKAGRIVREGVGPHDVAYLPQAAEVDRSFPMNVLDLVMLGAWRQTGAFRAAGRAVAERGQQALRTVGLDGLARRPIGSLSAGQFQRVLFARLLVQDASIIILDEPFASIDARTTSDLLNLVRGWHGEGRTVVAVLHDFDQVRAHFPQCLLLAREQVAWGPTADALSEAALRHARILSERWDDDDLRGRDVAA